jgi:hypothetical protein
MTILLGLLAAEGAAAKRPRPRSAAAPRPRATRKRPPAEQGQDAWPIRKITRAAPAEVAANRKRVMGWYARARKEISPRLHLLETRNFLIFSAWGRQSDKRLGQVCETMYRHLRRQFALPAGQQVWAGKLPIFIFDQKDHFARFTNEVDERRMASAGGYVAQWADGLCYMVLNRARDETYFYGLLVHEGTHAFLARYGTDAPLPGWVNEGLAEAMSAWLVPGCRAAQRHVDATRQALRKRKKVERLFEEVRLEDFDYGVAQGLVRYLVARDRRAFVRFIKLMKLGVDDGEALKQAYGLSRQQFVAQWTASSRTAAPRKR